MVQCNLGCLVGKLGIICFLIELNVKSGKDEQMQSTDVCTACGRALEGVADLCATQHSACEPALHSADLEGSWKLERTLSRVTRSARKTGRNYLKRLKQLNLGLIKKNLKGDLMIVSNSL